MQKAKVRRDKRAILKQGRFVVEFKAFEVPVGKRFSIGGEAQMGTS
jgi:hypothetical protein